MADNIEAFGRDPRNLTIFGQLGGGGKVTRFMQMRSAKGLFQRVVSESGGSLNPRATDPAKSIERQQAVAAATLKSLNLLQRDDLQVRDASRHRVGKLVDREGRPTTSS